MSSALGVLPLSSPPAPPPPVPPAAPGKPPTVGGPPAGAAPPPPGANPPPGNPKPLVLAGPAVGIAPLCARADGGERVAHGRGQEHADGGEREDDEGATVHEVRAEQCAGDHDPREQERAAQPRAPVGSATEQHERPDRRRRDDAREHRARLDVVAPLPEHPRAHADQRADRGRQRDRVVGVDDALAEAERDAGDEQPPAPEDERGAHAVGAGEAPAPRESGDEQDERGGEQPRDLRAELGAEHAGETGRSPTAALAAATADAAGLVAGETTEAVVSEDQLEHAVALRAADVGARRGGPQLDDGDPPARRREQRDRTPA